MSAKTKTKKLTPLMQQYFDIKSKHPDALLLFRVGDFYETFGEDAVKAADILSIVLTKRNNGGSDIELAGFPYHSLDVYLPKLVRAGYRVAICDQLEKPSKEKKIVKRGITDVVSPGVTTHDNILEQKSNNYLAAISLSKEGIGIAFLDVSTGEFLVSQGQKAQIDKLLQSFMPSELLISKDQKAKITEWFGDEFYSFNLDPWVFVQDYTREKLLNHFGVNTLKGFGIEELPFAQIAAGAILHHLESTEVIHVNHIQNITRIQHSDHVWMDRFTIRNLELIASNHPSGVPLIQIIDHTQCPMGARLLKKWLLFPLVDLESIQKRHDVIDFVMKDSETKESLSKAIKKIGDLERVASKLAIGRVGPRDFLHIHHALIASRELKVLLEKSVSDSLKELGDVILDLETFQGKIETEVRDDAPAVAAKGNIFKDGFDAELDECNNLIRNSKETLVSIQQREAEATGITNLKIGFNNVFGYYLEVTNKYKNQGLIPESWIRKQTLTGSERYITPELKELESKILGAESTLQQIEERLFAGLVQFGQNYVKQLLINAQVIAKLDCMLSLAHCAFKHGYHRPQMSNDGIIQIKEGRHPVIEQQLPLGESYIPNDILLDPSDQQIIMITGPNMSGKSAVLRQTAIIVLMAQMGAFVPAKSAHIGIVDKLFTRVGASDNISSGESTFMVEMNETASIMNNISDRSLVLLDEIGRGTSTYDGISIAWSLAEFLHNHPKNKAKTLFATHYHELNELAQKYPRIKNFHVSTRELGNKVIFLRKLKEGGSQHSFGIHVARMAGMPVGIVKRAQEILLKLEQKSINKTDGKNKEDIKESLSELPQEPVQLNFFDAKDPLAEKIKEKLSDIDVNRLTPIECMMELKNLTDLLYSAEINE